VKDIFGSGEGWSEEKEKTKSVQLGFTHGNMVGRFSE
jgi:hypothetical protein